MNTSIMGNIDSKSLETLGCQSESDIALLYKFKSIRCINDYNKYPDILSAIFKNIKHIIASIREKKNDNEFNKGPYPGAYNGALKWEKSHDGHYTKTNQHEKNIAKGLFNLFRSQKRPQIKFQQAAKLKSLTIGDNPKSRIVTSIGEVLDYEIPIFRVGNCNIDLIAVKKTTNGNKGDNDQLFLIELKRNRSPESLLRCILEAYTYSVFVDRSRLKESYNVSQRAKIFVCPLIFEGSSAHNDLMALAEGDGRLLVLKDLIEAIEENDREIEIVFAVMKADPELQFPDDCANHQFEPEWLDLPAKKHPQPSSQIIL